MVVDLLRSTSWFLVGEVMERADLLAYFISRSRSIYSLPAALAAKAATEVMVNRIVMVY